MSGTRPLGGKTSSSTSSLISLALACVVASILLASAASQRVDCRKFVFAPTCRGVAAKRTALEVVSRKDSEDPEITGKMVAGLSESPGRGRLSDEEESREEDKLEEEEDEPEDGDEDEEGERKYERATTVRRGGRNLGRSFKDRRFGRTRKSSSSLSFMPNRKVARAPSTYEWFSNDKRRRRNKGLRRRSEYRNYDY